MANGRYNGTGDGDPEENGKDNVIRIPTLAERDAMRREAERRVRKEAGKGQPFLNLPPATSCVLGLFVGIHVFVHVLLSVPMQEWVILTFGFVPGRFTGTVPFDAFVLVSPFSYMLLHGGWLHLAINSVMMAAFGSGIERWIGPRRMIMFFVLCGLFGAAAHFALNPFSPLPVIGASGALSGLFAAAIVMMNRGRGEPGGRFGILPFAVLWIGLSVAFGMVGAPGGGAVAWAAHVGGFLGGFAALKILRI